MIDEIDGALGDGKGAVEVILKMVFDFISIFDALMEFICGTKMINFECWYFFFVLDIVEDLQACTK